MGGATSMAGQRIERLQEQIKKEVSAIIRTLKDPGVGFVSVTGVELTGDMRHAKVFVSVFGDAAEKEATLAALVRARGYVRSEVGQRVRMRFTPEIHFVLDGSIERGARIDQLLKQATPERPANEAAKTGEEGTADA